MGWGKWLAIAGAAVGGAVTGGAGWAALPGLISAGSKIAGGVMQSRATGKAAGQLQEGVQAGIGVQREALDPYMQAGKGQLSNLSRMANLGPEDIAKMARMDPSYEFRRKEGMRGLEASASAKGTLLTGGTLRDVIRYNQEFAGTEYGRAYGRASEGVQRQFGRASTIAGMGQKAAGDFAGDVTDLTTAGANVAAEETVQKGNIWGDVLGSVANTIGTMATAGRKRASAYGQSITTAYNPNPAPPGQVVAY